MVSYRKIEGGGVYKVTSITQRPSEHPGKTFVQLEQQSAWTKNAPKEPKLELAYGPTANGGYESSGSIGLEFTVGERFGALIAHFDNFFATSPNWIFESTGSEVTNGYGLFNRMGLSMKEVGKKVGAAYIAVRQGKDCPFDIKPTPDINPEENQMKSGDDEWDGKRQTQQGD
jgi:hypothetical protein